MPEGAAPTDGGVPPQHALRSIKVSDFRDLDKLRDLLSSAEPEGLGLYLASPQPGVPMFQGTTIPILGGSQSMQLTPGGLIVPKSDSDIDPLAGTYLTSDEYLALELRNRQDFVARLADQHNRLEMVAQVAALNHIRTKPEEPSTSSYLVGSRTDQSRPRSLILEPGH